MAALERIGNPEDIARIVLFLVGEDSAWVTAQNIGANGSFASTIATLRENRADWLPKRWVISKK